MYTCFVAIIPRLTPTQTMSTPCLDACLYFPHLHVPDREVDARFVMLSRISYETKMGVWLM